MISFSQDQYNPYGYDILKKYKYVYFYWFFVFFHSFTICLFLILDFFFLEVE